MVTVENFRTYLRSPPDNNENLQSFLNAAKSSARGAGIANFQNNAKYELFIYALASNYYDNRGLQYSGSYQGAAEENARRMINAYTLELRHATEDNGTEPPPWGNEK